MTTATVKKAYIFLIPACLFLAAFWALPQLKTMPPSRQELIVMAPYAAMGFGMFLCAHFHRGRSFFVLLNLAVFYWCARTFLPGGPTGISGDVLYRSFCMILPFNIAIFSLMRERGIFTITGRLRFAFLFAQAAFTFWLVKTGTGPIQMFLSREFHQSNLLEKIALPQISLPLFALAFAIVTVKAVIRQSPIDSGMLGALAAVTVACSRIGNDQVLGIFVTTAAIILALSVIQDSYNMAFRDDLTGLSSRRALNEQVHWLGRTYTLAMLDVDHFKKFNDTYGHDVGDQVLKMVAGKMRQVGGGGKVFRYGGEEFTIIFPGKELAEAGPHLELLRKTIADYQLWLRSTDRPANCKDGKNMRAGKTGKMAVSVTVSIGVAQSSESLRKPADVIKAADKALYRAKGKGRNMVCT